MNKRRFQKKTPTNPVFIPSLEYRTKILEQVAYIGQQGFTMLKSEMDPADLKDIKTVLTVEPIVPFSGPKTEVVSFPVFRENEKKIYIPRFYGESRYGGNPAKIELSLGDSISVPFVKPIRDYQEKIIQVYLDHIGDRRSGGGILEVPCGRGKCLGKDTPILMYDGSLKMVQDILVGDVLMGDDSNGRNVLTLARGREKMYEIKEKNVIIYGEEFVGESYIVNESHILSLIDITTKNIIDISVKDYLILPKHLQQKLYGYRVPVVFTEMEEIYDMYTIGNTGMRIPIKCHSTNSRLALLAGMIDRFGMLCTSNRIKMKHKNLLWIEDCIFIARSLGIEIHRTENKQVVVLSNGIWHIPFR